MNERDVLAEAQWAAPVTLRIHRETEYGNGDSRQKK
jgi:hypothetical protein